MIRLEYEAILREAKMRILEDIFFSSTCIHEQIQHPSSLVGLLNEATILDENINFGGNFEQSIGNLKDQDENGQLE